MNAHERFDHQSERKFEPNRFSTGGKSKGWSCFVPGTQINTSNGSQSIDRIRENDVLLVNGYTGEYGEASDETVVMQVDSPTLYGFSKVSMLWYCQYIEQCR